MVILIRVSLKITLIFIHDFMNILYNLKENKKWSI